MACNWTYLYGTLDIPRMPFKIRCCIGIFFAGCPAQRPVECNNVDDNHDQTLQATISSIQRLMHLVVPAVMLPQLLATPELPSLTCYGLAQVPQAGVCKLTGDAIALGVYIEGTVWQLLVANKMQHTEVSRELRHVGRPSQQK